MVSHWLYFDIRHNLSLFALSWCVCHEHELGWCGLIVYVQPGQLRLVLLAPAPLLTLAQLACLVGDLSPCLLAGGLRSGC